MGNMHMQRLNASAFTFICPRVPLEERDSWRFQPPFYFQIQPSQSPFHQGLRLWRVFASPTRFFGPRLKWRCRHCHPQLFGIGSTSGWFLSLGNFWKFKFSVFKNIVNCERLLTIRPVFNLYFWKSPQNLERLFVMCRRPLWIIKGNVGFCTQR